MRVTLGERTYDVTTRSLVIAIVDASDDAARALADGADVIDAPDLHLDRDDPLLVDITVPPPAAWAEISVAVARGCRLVRVPAPLVRGARRVCDVLAAILEAPA
jgi:hypothetical protein